MSVANETPSERPGRTVAEKLQEITGPWTRRNLLAWVGVLATVLIIHWGWFQPFWIPTESMEPTLRGRPGFLQGDRVAVNKFIYGLRVPFMKKHLFRLAEPRRWDIVVFDPVGDADRTRVVKRIAGLPGERVAIKEGRLYVDGALEALPDALPADTYYVNDADLDRIMARLDSERERRTMEALRQEYPLRYGVSDEDAFSLVPADCYFVLGDNSINSIDSRHYGWAPRDHLLGRVFCTWWPVGRWRDFTGFSHTWWGQALLYGLPCLFVLYEVIRYLRRNPEESSAS